MKQFFKMVLATMLGFILSYVVVIFFVVGLIFVVVSSVSDDGEERAVKNSILTINLNYPMSDRTSANPFEDFDWADMHASKKLGLNDVLKLIRKAASDENIQGIYIDLASIQCGMASLEEIRNELLEFKKSNKFIYAYGETISQSAYYLGSVADKIYLNPQGMLELKGLRSELLFFKKSLEKLEIEAQIIRHGKYKGAVEPFINDKMSDENREQITVLVQSVWSHIKLELGKSRKISPEEIQEMADNFRSRSADDALKLRLVDSLTYMDGMIAVLRRSLELKEKEKLTLVKLNQYKNMSNGAKMKFQKEKIAIIYASGAIESGQGDQESIGSTKFSETIRKAREDSSIKAIVLRVNSPGGSALASEVIWREIVLAKKAKPVVVSMGDVAASGGYYIACAANKIVAESNTITGSIGVFGVFMNGQKLLNNKLGIYVDTVKTSRYADIGTPTRPLSESEKSIFLEIIENIYSVFVGRVAEGRGMSIEAVDLIGQGRVWTGEDAKRLGLVDEIGGLDDAIKLASKLSNTEDYKLLELPERKDPFQEVINELTSEVKSSWIKNEIGADYKYYRQLQSVLSQQGIQTRMPFQIELY